MSQEHPDDRLIANIQYKDEWPIRIGKFIADLAKWYAAHPYVRESSTREIATFLESVAFDQGVIHERCVFSSEINATGQTEHTFESCIIFDDACRSLAVAAFERYGNLNAA